MVSIRHLLSGDKRKSKDSSRDRKNNGGSPSSSQQDLCEVSGHDHFFCPSTPRPLVHLLTLLVGDLCLTKFRSVENDPNTSKVQVSSTHTAEEPAREPNSRSASTHLATTLESLRSADTVDLRTPGNPSCNSISPSMTHQPHREAVRQGHALPCVECGRHPQAIGDLCLGCNSSIEKSNEPRLKELNLLDPTVDSRTFRTPATQPWPLTLFQSSLTSTISGKVQNQSKSEKSTRFASHVTWLKPGKLTSAVLVLPNPKMELIELICYKKILAPSWPHSVHHAKSKPSTAPNVSATWARTT